MEIARSGKLIVLDTHALVAHAPSMKLIDYRNENDLSASELARSIGVSHTTILRLEQYKIAPSQKLVAAIVKATGGKVMPNDLFAADDPTEAPSCPST